MNIRSSFSSVSVLIIGDLMLDRYWWGDVSRISPEAPVPVVHLKRQSSAPGGAANVACNVAGLGAAAMLVGFVGADADADEFRRSLGENGGSDEHIIERASVPTNVKTRVIAHNQQVVRVDQEQVVALLRDDESAICARVSHLIPASDIVIVSDYQKGTLSPNVLRHIIETAGKFSKKVLVDPKGKDFAKYAGASIITPNRREAAEASKFEELDQSLIATVGQQLIDNLKLEAVLITRSDEGMSLFVKGQSEIHLRAETKEIYDVTGAGDTVIATLAVALAAGCDYIEAAEIANIAAGIVVEQLGTSAITIEQLLPALDSARTLTNSQPPR